MSQLLKDEEEFPRWTWERNSRIREQFIPIDEIMKSFQMTSSAF